MPGRRSGLGILQRCKFVALTTNTASSFRKGITSLGTHDGRRKAMAMPVPKILTC
jgi:hypothetical protein